MVRTIVVLVTILMIGIGCAGGKQYRVDLSDGTYYKVDDVGHTNLVRRGSQYGNFKLCDPNYTPPPVPMPGPIVDANGCKTVAEKIESNPSIAEQLAGPAATVGGAKLLSDGFAESGDTNNINATATGGNGAAMAVNNPPNVVINNKNGGCKGNCAKKGFAP